MENEKQKKVMAVVWAWKTTSTNKTAERPVLKNLLLESLIPIFIGLLLWFAAKHHTMAIVVFCIAAFVLLSGLFAPSLHYAFKRIFQKFAVGVGLAMTWLLLLPFFYIFFTVGRLSHIIFKKDPMNRACPTKMDTYWIKHPAMTDIESYSRQY